MKNNLAAAWRTTVWVVAFGGMLVGRDLSAATLAIQSTNAPPGGSVDVCVAVSSGGQPVAGAQANLHWDGSCTAVNMAGGTAAQCRANPGTGKNVQTSVGQRPCHNDPNCLTALLFSVSDNSLIPDGQLFCCSFSVLNAPSSARCDINITDAILSPPTGGRLQDVKVENGSIFVTNTGGGAAPAGPARVGGAPVVSGGGGVPAAPAGVAPAPGGVAPAGRAAGAAPNIVQGIPPPAEEAPIAPGEAAPGGAAPPPTSEAKAPTAVATPQRTPAAASTPTTKVPTPRPTAAAVVKSPTPAPTAAPTAGATPRQERRRHKKHAKPTPES